MTLYEDTKCRIAVHLLKGDRDTALALMHDLHDEQPESAEVLRGVVLEQFGEWLE